MSLQRNVSQFIQYNEFPCAKKKKNTGKLWDNEIRLIELNDLDYWCENRFFCNYPLGPTNTKIEN